MWILIKILKKLFKSQPTIQTRDFSHFDNWNVYHDNKIVKQHYKYYEKIEELYKIANALEDKNSTQMMQCIELCKKDIEISKLFKDICIETHQPIPQYPSFKRLAIIYDKQKNYNEAIKICTQALMLGFTDSGNMYSRLSRLLKKANAGPIEAHLDKFGIKI